MKKTEIVARFKEHIENAKFDITDKPALRQEWVLFLDNLQRNGEITEKQRSSISQPSFVRKAK